MLVRLLAVLCFLAAVQALRRSPLEFVLGRRHGGFLLGPPEKEVMMAKATKTVQTKYFTQKLDNFDSSNTATWQQRYMVNDGYYKAGGPIFVFIGGEGEISAGWMTYGDWVKNARTHNALLFQPEHRYYGASHPTPDASTANLKWLSSEQALADLANFITSMKLEYSIPNAKVIVFGGSYPGNLAAWFREKYPNIADGAIASSAPVLAKADFFEYLETVGQAMDYYVPGCSNNVKQAVQQIDTIIQAGGSLNGKITLCGSFNLKQPDARAAFYQELIGAWMGTTQYNNQQGGAPTVKDLCNTMGNAANGDLPTRLYRVFEQVYGAQCIDPETAGTIQYYQETDWNSGAVSGGGRTWLYQTCTEFGYYQTTDSNAQPFGNAVTVSFTENEYCKGIFGIDTKAVDASVKKTNDNYHGKSLDPGTTKIVFINGSIDPWHPLSVLTGLSDTVVSCYITGTSHCQDMQGAQFGDSAELTHCRQVITDNLAKWLA